MSNSTIKTQSK